MKNGPLQRQGPRGLLRPRGGRRGSPRLEGVRGPRRAGERAVEREEGEAATCSTSRQKTKGENRGNSGYVSRRKPEYVDSKVDDAEFADKEVKNPFTCVIEVEEVAEEDEIGVLGRFYDRTFKRGELVKGDEDTTSQKPNPDEV